MEYDVFWSQLFQALKENPDYREAVNAVGRLEAAYLAALEHLTESRRERIEAYICACDAESDSMIIQAYHLGYSRGRADSFLL